MQPQTAPAQGEPAFTLEVDNYTEYVDRVGQTTEETPPAVPRQVDPLGLRKIDHVRFFVGNARQAAYFYRNAFGFDVVAYAGLETKSRHEAGYVLRQGEITFVVASPLGTEHPENQRLVKH